MSLNDEREKLRQAKEWLGDSDLLVTSEKFLASWDHVCYVYQTTKDCELKSQATKIMTDLMGTDWLN